MKDPFRDPFAKLDPFRNLGGPSLPGGGSTAVARAPHRQPLEKAESASFARSALDTGATGLGYVLGAIDKPAQAVRGVLAGKGVSSLKHLVPFSGSMGLTTDADKTSGRDLTDKLGLTDRRSKGWGAWGAGLAADIATDPLTFATFGAGSAATKGGSAIKALGTTKGWSRQQLLKGFDASTAALTAAGTKADDIAHMINQGKKVASTADEAAWMAAHPGSAAADIAGKPLAGLARAKVPFLPGYVAGTGPAAQKVAGALDRTGQALRFGNPVGRAIGGLFNANVGGAVDKVTQMGFEKHGLPAADAGARVMRAQNHDLIAKIDPLLKSAGVPESYLTRAAVAGAEGTPHAYAPGLMNDVAPIVDHLTEARRRYMGEASELGLPLQDAGDRFAAYVHRQATKAGEGGHSPQIGSSGENNLFPLTGASNIRRKAELRNVPGGSDRINDWYNRFAGMATKPEIKANAKLIRSDIERDFLANSKVMGPHNLPVLAEAWDKQARRMAARVGRSDEAYRSTAATATDPAREGLPYFTPDIVATQASREAQHARTVAAARAAFGTIGDAASPGGGGTPVTDILRQIGLKSSGGLPITDLISGKVTGHTPVEGAIVKMIEALAPRGMGKVGSFAGMAMKDVRRAVGGYTVPETQAAQILKAYAKWNAPEQIKGGLGAWDSFANSFKSLVYPVWLPSHVRNAASAATNNAWAGTKARDYLDQLQVMTGRGKRDLSHLGGTPEAIRRAQHVSGGVFGDANASQEVAGSAGQALKNAAIGVGPDRFTPAIPGSSSASSGSLPRDAFDLLVKRGIGGTAKAFGKTAMNAVRDPMAFSPTNLGSGRLSDVFNPVAIRGVNGAVADNLPAVAAGRELGSHIENFMRGALWNGQVRGGASPNVAGDLIDKLHFDYGRVTDFEKNVMRRIMPFYTFSRRNLPLQASQLAARPGMLANTYRPFSQGERGYVPEYLRSGVAIPTGPEQDGKRQYVSQLGLPGEEAFGRLHMKNGLPDLKATAFDVLGQTNPLIKGTLEQLFDRQMHTGRKLSDLRSTGTASALGKLVGDDNPQLLSQVLANSPITRFVSSADKILDDRKGIVPKLANVLTGVRVTDVDAEKLRAIELRDKTAEALKGMPHVRSFTNYFPEPGAALSPKAIEALRFNAMLLDRARDFAKSQKGKPKTQTNANQKIGVRP